VISEFVVFWTAVVLTNKSEKTAFQEVQPEQRPLKIGWQLVLYFYTLCEIFIKGKMEFTCYY